jgi:hypothetical protein
VFTECCTAGISNTICIHKVFLEGAHKLAEVVFLVIVLLQEGGMAAALIAGEGVAEDAVVFKGRILMSLST